MKENYIYVYDEKKKRTSKWVVVWFEDEKVYAKDFFFKQFGGRDEAEKEALDFLKFLNENINKLI